ncbi:MAG: hypothetical protein ACYC99_01365 [Candidatus Geothermincolia bacterium]
MRKGWAWLRSKHFTLAVIGLVLVLLVAASLVQVSLDHSATARAGWSKSSPFDTGRSVLDVLGGVRQTLAAYFWTKTDNIHHEYYGGDPTREQSLFTYYWLTTRLDPHYTMAYYYASYMLCRFGKTEEGLRLAQEGVANNPDSALLQENLASIYLFFEKDPEKALYHNEKALELATDSGDKRSFLQLQRVIKRVLSGEIKVPEPIPLKEATKVNPEAHENKTE